LPAASLSISFSSTSVATCFKAPVSASPTTRVKPGRAHSAKRRWRRPGKFTTRYDRQARAGGSTEGRPAAAHGPRGILGALGETGN